MRLDNGKSDGEAKAGAGHLRGPLRPRVLGNLALMTHFCHPGQTGILKSNGLATIGPRVRKRGER